MAGTQLIELSKRTLRKILLLALLMPTAAVSAQGPAIQGSDKKREKPPALETVLLETKDRVELRADWLGGIHGKETMPVILLHEWDSNRAELRSFATRMQLELEVAVIVPDFRGHGDSISVKGSDKELDRSRFKKKQLATLSEDIDTCRRFLQKQNDLGECNLDLLTVIACGKNCAHAVNWCVTDWSWQPIKGIKQGQNVKALVMLSPQKKFKSVSLTPGLKTPLFRSTSQPLPVLLIWGEEDKTSNDEAQSLYSSLTKSRRQPETFTSDQERLEKQTVYRIPVSTDAQSSDLINANPDRMLKTLKTFYELKLVPHKDKYAWQSRADKKK